jgi:hypothetical protein
LVDVSGMEIFVFGLPSACREASELERVTGKTSRLCLDTQRAMSTYIEWMARTYFNGLTSFG